MLLYYNVFYLLTFICTDRPLAPTSLSATLVTACTVNITWVIAQTSLQRIATSRIIFEVFIRGSQQLTDWVEIGHVDVDPRSTPQQTSLRGVIPPNGVNTSYYLRARNVNMSIGESMLEVPDAFTAYTEGG